MRDARDVAIGIIRWWHFRDEICDWTEQQIVALYPALVSGLAEAIIAARTEMQEAAAKYIEDQAGSIHRMNAFRRDGRLPGAPVMENEAARLDSHAHAIRALDPQGTE